MDTSVDWVNGLAFSAGKPYSPVAAFGNQLSLFGESSSAPAVEIFLGPSEEAAEPGSASSLPGVRVSSRLSVADMRLLKQLYDVVKMNLANQEFRVEDLAYELGFCPRQLQRKIRNLLGKTPLDYIRALRLQEARHLLEDGVYTTVKEVAAAVGFSRNYFYRLYHQHYGHVASKDLTRDIQAAVPGSPDDPNHTIHPQTVHHSWITMP